MVATAWSTVGVLPLGEVSAGSDPAYNAMILADNPVAYWTLDGSSAGLLDQTGHGHDAVNHGATAGRFITGGAQAFNGLGQYLEVPNDLVFSPVTNAITVEAWMAPGALTFPVMQGNNQYVNWLGKNGLDATDSVNAEWIARMYREFPTVEPDRSNRISGYAFNRVPPPGNPDNLGSGSYFQDPIVVNEFLHYVLVINPISGLVKVYRDGDLRDSDPLTSFGVTPEHGDAPVRIGTATLASFFLGRIARMAIYTYELPRARIAAHFRQVLPPPPGTGQWVRRTGQAFGRSTGTRLRITVGSAGVPAGATLIADAGQSYTAGGAVMNDSRGNVWVRERTGADAGTILRGAQFRCQVKTPLRFGDKIELRTPAPTTARVLTVNEYSNLLFEAVHAQNAVSGTSSTPGVTLSLPTTVPDTLVCGSLITAGPVSDTYTPDALHDFVDRARAGSSTGDGGDLTAVAVSKNAIAAATQRWTPTISPSRPWVEIAAAYLTGTPVWTPPAQGTARLVAELAGVHSSANAASLTVPLNGEGVPVGHTLIATVNANYTAAAPTITDSAGNTWVADRTAAVPGNLARVVVIRCRVTNPIPAGATVTVTWASAITHKDVLVQQYSGLMVPTVIDTQDGGSGTSGSPSQTLTTSNPNTLLISAVGMAGPADALYDSDISWVEDRTIGTSGNGASDRTLYSSHKIVAAAGPNTFTPVLAGGYAYTSLLVAYRAV